MPVSASSCRYGAVSQSVSLSVFLSVRHAEPKEPDVGREREGGGDGEGGGGVEGGQGEGRARMLRVFDIPFKRDPSRLGHTSFPPRPRRVFSPLPGARDSIEPRLSLSLLPSRPVGARRNVGSEKASHGE